jgi:F-box and WD-40 domain protein CDC4
MASEACVHVLHGHLNRVYTLILAKDRPVVVSGSLDTTIRVWDINDGRMLHVLIGHQSLTSGL